MTTRKDFEQTAANIAYIVAEARASWEGAALAAALATAEDIASQMAAGYGRDNPRFDRARFLAACGF